MKRRFILMALIALIGAVAYARRFDFLTLLPLAALPVAAHDQYAIGLRLTGLAGTPEGGRWSEAAERSLQRAVAVRSRHERTVSFEGNPGQVASWRLDVRRGQRLAIRLVAEPDTVFVDVFDDAGTTRVTSGPPRALRLEHLVTDDGGLIVRLQPRLGIVQSVTAKQIVRAGFRFPVPAVSGRAVHSAFGAARDNGARQHEGIDIFAPPDTPVVAAADGRIGSQTTNRLGGNVVWLFVSEARVSFYYAHLIRHAVRPGDRVVAGDVVGYVGNTGNARTTAPHLHLGVYAAAEGAVDPLPFVVDPES